MFKGQLTAHKALLGTLTAVFAFTACTLLAVLAPGQAQAAVKYIQVDSAFIYRSDYPSDAESVPGFSFNPSTNTLTLSNATLNVSKTTGVRINALETDTVKVALKGNNTINATQSWTTGFQSDSQLSFSGGNLTINNMSTAVDGYKVFFGSGTYRFNKCTSWAVYGKLGISIAKAANLYVSTDTPSTRYALYSSYGSISNDPVSLKSVAGQLSQGAKFIGSGGLYQVVENSRVKLLSWKSGKTAKLSKFKYGGYEYSVTQIGANAFNNAAGKKVKKIVLCYSVNTIGKNAFKNTKALTNLDLKDWYTNILYSKGMSFNKKAFAGCGKQKGKKLKVHTGARSGKYFTTNPRVKKALKKKGLPSKAKVVK